jgi:very-short-patch-repair endonuclease
VARDRQRDELLRRAGWDVVRVMPHELSRPEDFVSRVWQAHALRLAALQVARPA